MERAVSRPCPECCGDGTLDYLEHGPSGPTDRTEACSSCGGTGRAPAEPESGPTDTELLDWFEREFCSTGPYNDRWHIERGLPITARGPTLRDALRAALKAEAERKP
jgi:hypothetical protein